MRLCCTVRFMCPALSPLKPDPYYFPKRAVFSQTTFEHLRSIVSYAHVFLLFDCHTKSCALLYCLMHASVCISSSEGLTPLN